MISVALLAAVFTAVSASQNKPLPHLYNCTKHPYLFTNCSVFLYVTKGVAICSVQLLEHGSLVSKYKDLYQCTKTQWGECLTTRSVSHTNFTSYFPCGSHHISIDQGTELSYNIVALPVFQINLTFVRFLLKRDLWGCSFHHVLVRCRAQL